MINVNTKTYKYEYHYLPWYFCLKVNKFWMFRLVLKMLLIKNFIFWTYVLFNKNTIILLRRLDFMFYWKKFLVNSLELVIHRYNAKNVYYEGQEILKLLKAALQRCSCKKGVSKNMPQIHRRTSMSKCDSIKVAKHVLLHIFRTPFPKNTSQGLLL